MLTFWNGIAWFLKCIFFGVLSWSEKSPQDGMVAMGSVQILKSSGCLWHCDLDALCRAERVRQIHHFLLVGATKQHLNNHLGSQFERNQGEFRLEANTFWKKNPGYINFPISFGICNLKDTCFAQEKVRAPRTLLSIAPVGMFSSWSGMLIVPGEKRSFWKIFQIDNYTCPWSLRPSKSNVF